MDPKETSPEAEVGTEEKPEIKDEALKAFFDERQAERKKGFLIGADETEVEEEGKPERMLLNFGPQHPATHGTLRTIMELEGETVVRAEPVLGYLHTGFEKLGEYRSYNQFVTLTDRLNYLSPLANNIGYAMAVEKLMGIEVPRRAQVIRTIQAELTRIADHCVWLGTHALDIGAFTVFLYAFRQREFIYDLFEISTGSRLTTSYTRIGGLFRDFPADHADQLKNFCGQFRVVFGQVEGLLNRNKIWQDRTQQVGVIDAETAMDFGFTGPMLRGSGVDYDIRKDEPYLLYDELDFVVPVGTHGDTFDRYLVRMEEMRQSISLVEQALERLEPGPVNVDDGTVILPPKERVYNSIEGLIHHFKMIMDHHGINIPKGETYYATEAPNGELGFYIVSDGSDMPYRIRIRPPSLYHYQALPYMLEGNLLGDAVAILGSMNVIAGELDR